MNADDPLVAKLARFTPTTGELDRDELLFRAGQASVRPGRGWKVIAGILAGTQAATLAVWLTNDAVPPPSVATPAGVGVSEPTPPPPASPTADPSSYLALSRNWDGEPLTRPAPAGPSDARPGPVLTAGWRGDPIN